MDGEFEQYPLAHEAVRTVWHSTGAADTEPLPSLAERTAEILRDYIDCPSREKETLMAAGALSWLQTGLADGYDSDVNSILLQIRCGIDPGLCGGGGRKALQVCTAARIAQYEKHLRDAALGRHDIHGLLGLQDRLDHERETLGRSAFANIGARRLQDFEIAIYRRLAESLDEKIQWLTHDAGQKKAAGGQN